MPALRRLSLLLPALVIVTASFAQDTRLVRDTEPLTPAEEQAKLHVPEGFTISLFAAEPMINKPINIAFDRRGRLWASSTVEYPYGAKQDRWEDEQGSRVRGSRDAIRILEDTDADGVADRVTVFADGLNIPTGVLPWHKPEHKDGCIAWSIPNLWYLADTDGDGLCDHREVLFGPLGWEKDTHGMCSSLRDGRDGWIYATHGFNNTSHFKARDGSTLELHSGNVFRFRPDGSGIEIWSRGQVNPFGLAFDRRGNLYSADCHSAPIYQLLRGAYYPSFGKPHDGLGFGPAMCGHSHGSTGICGIVYLDGGIWGEEWDDRILIGNVVTSRVNLDRIDYRGSSPEAVEQPDFVVSDDPWFRPVDLCLGPDGALYIADFYNRIIGHYEVPLEHPGRDRERGRIWRITKPGAKAPPPHESPVPAARPTQDWTAVLESTDASPFDKRDAAAALFDRPAAGTTGPLLKTLRSTPEEDSHLRHALRLALREQLRQPGAFDALGEEEAPETAEIALGVPTNEAAVYLAGRIENETHQADLRLAHVARHAGDNATLLDRAIAARQRQLEGRPAEQLAAISAVRDALSEAGRPMTAALLAWAEPLARERLAQAKADGPNPWETLPAPGLPPGPSPWTVQERRGVDGTMVPVLSSLNPKEPGPEQRTGLLRSAAFPAPAKLEFWLCGHRGFPKNDPHDKNVARLVRADTGEVLRSAFPPRNDTCVAIAWDLAGLEGQSVRFELIDGDHGSAYAWLAAGHFTPAVVDVSGFGGADENRRILSTLATLLQQTAPAALREELAAYLPPRPAAPPPEVSAEERARLDALIRERHTTFDSAKASPEQGKTLFTQHCAACHQIGKVGGLVGPQLDGIGLRGAERLCEDILDPSRNVDTHFQMHTLTLKAGGTLSGFVRAEVGQLLLLVDSAGVEHRVPKAGIEKDETLAMSPMPPIFGAVLTPAQFHDLLAYLLKAP